MAEKLAVSVGKRPRPHHAVRTLTDHSGITWRIEEEDLRDVGLRVGQTAIVFTNQGGGRRWTLGIPSTLPFLSIGELRRMLEKAMPVPNG